MASTLRMRTAVSPVAAMDSCIVLIRTRQHGLAPGERTVLKFPANSYHMYTVGLAFALTSAVNSGIDDRNLSETSHLGLCHADES